MPTSSLESLERLLAFVDCRMGDLVEIGPGGSVRADADRIREAARLGFLKRARVGKTDRSDFVDVESFDKAPALAILLRYCVARDARPAYLADRVAADAPPRIEIPASLQRPGARTGGRSGRRDAA
ncbi:hypothetical protein [Paludisphaera soli]|uniref:hypothetical protein n=1 Tax=Paludisphaera soli TaxID=2712865 RepID=UPI0013EE2F6A|nr:hypothetical protein [Paludisphaera soli]